VIVVIAVHRNRGETWGPMARPDGAVSVHVIHAVLRIVLRHQNQTVLPDRASAKCVSTMRPSARSSSATMARGVGDPGRRTIGVIAIESEGC